MNIYLYLQCNHNRIPVFIQWLIIYKYCANEITFHQMNRDTVMDYLLKRCPVC